MIVMICMMVVMLTIPLIYICMMVKNEDDQGLQRWCIMLESRFHLIQFASGEESKVNARIRQVAIPTPSEMYQTRFFLICD